MVRSALWELWDPATYTRDLGDVSPTCIPRHTDLGPGCGSCGGCELAPALLCHGLGAPGKHCLIKQITHRWEGLCGSSGFPWRSSSTPLEQNTWVWMHWRGQEELSNFTASPLPLRWHGLGPREVSSTCDFSGNVTGPLQLCGVLPKRLASLSTCRVLNHELHEWSCKRLGEWQVDSQILLTMLWTPSGSLPMSLRSHLDHGFPNWSVAPTVLCASDPHTHPPRPAPCVLLVVAVRASFGRWLARTCGKPSPVRAQGRDHKRELEHHLWENKRESFSVQPGDFSIKRKHTGLSILPQNGARSLEHVYRQTFWKSLRSSIRAGGRCFSPKSKIVKTS